MNQVQLLVIGAGPYALSIAALARERGIGSVVLGRPMGFWRENMPEGMFLRSGPDWHLDGAAVHTLEAYLEDQGIRPGEVDPIPVGVFLDYAAWFKRAKGIEVREEFVDTLVKANGRFEATLRSGERIRADAVVAAPGIRHYASVPGWASSLPPGLAAHTCDLVRFDDMAGARVLIIGGRQSAYEWAALSREHGAARIDIVHRHDIPRFERVSWKFVDAHVEQTLAVRGYWRNLPTSGQDAIARRFWEVGRLTLEYWLTPRLAWDGIHRWPGTEVVEVTPVGDDELRVLLSNGTGLAVDRVVFGSGYRAELTKVPYLAGVLKHVKVSNGFPVLDEAFQTSLDGLYVTGFSATQDFGPFFGFVKGSPAAATLIVRDLLSRR
ncbi:MAG TPA: FAD-dependent oxidoreductase [Streptosporangiaceae bacterium]|jgi:cation diffusion facilitator CzcD-associated flavoprotein CzcO|nr:FAD-dependent oxidoreductase [Streptosporangiaceae bacterium]